MRRPGPARAAASMVIAAALALTATACATGADDSPAPADPSLIAESASSWAIAPELVFTTVVVGYDLAPQSVGPSNSEGMSATWVDSSTSAMLTIRTEPGCELSTASRSGAGTLRNAEIGTNPRSPPR